MYQKIKFAAPFATSNYFNKKCPYTCRKGHFCFRLRRGRDSNPRYPFEVYTLSRRALSTTQTPLHLCGDLIDHSITPDHFFNRERKGNKKSVPANRDASRTQLIQN
jgi:hypothetical protein